MLCHNKGSRGSDPGPGFFGGRSVSGYFFWKVGTESDFFLEVGSGSGYLFVGRIRLRIKSNRIRNPGLGSFAATLTDLSQSLDWDVKDFQYDRGWVKGRMWPLEFVDFSSSALHQCSRYGTDREGKRKLSQGPVF